MEKGIGIHIKSGAFLFILSESKYFINLQSQCNVTGLHASPCRVGYQTVKPAGVQGTDRSRYVATTTRRGEVKWMTILEKP